MLELRIAVTPEELALLQPALNAIGEQREQRARQEQEEYQRQMAAMFGGVDPELDDELDDEQQQWAADTTDHTSQSAQAPVAVEAKQAEPAVVDLPTLVKQHANKHGMPATMALIAKHGGKRVSDIPGENLAAFTAEVQRELA